MQCKCGKTVESQYEHTGKCEDCFAEDCAYGHSTMLKMDEETDLEDLTIAELELDLRTEGTLSNSGIIYVKYLVKMTEVELVRKFHFGVSVIGHIKEALQRFNLSLG